MVWITGLPFNPRLIASNTRSIFCVMINDLRALKKLELKNRGFMRSDNLDSRADPRPVAVGLYLRNTQSSAASSYRRQSR